MSDVTCWTVIEGAAAGRRKDRDEFARRYVPVVRAYLGARWRHSTLVHEIDDAVQEVFLDCFKEGGALGRVDPARSGGFRAFFYGVVRNVALRVETRRARRKERQASSGLRQLARDEDGLSTVFDRAWALSLLEQAVERHRRNAREQGETGARRVDVLRLRFEEGLPIRDIAKRWEMDAAKVHKEYARARDDFKAALMEVVAFHHPYSRAEVERECAQLLAILK